jgi:hypothetical protein
MFFELDKIESLNFEKDLPIDNISHRDVFKCNYKKQELKKNNSLDLTEIYYFTKNYKDYNNGAYLLLYFDDKQRDLVYFEYIRKSKEDLQSLEYIILAFLKKKGYDINNFSKSTKNNSYYRK